MTSQKVKWGPNSSTQRNVRDYKALYLCLLRAQHLWDYTLDGQSRETRLAKSAANSVRQSRPLQTQNQVWHWWREQGDFTWLLQVRGLSGTTHARHKAGMTAANSARLGQHRALKERMLQRPGTTTLSSGQSYASTKAHMKSNKRSKKDWNLI